MELVLASYKNTNLMQKSNLPAFPVDNRGTFALGCGHEKYPNPAGNIVLPGKANPLGASRPGYNFGKASSSKPTTSHSFQLIHP
ncbi:MAG: hypothetical protein LUE26_09655 [Alistipes sp.]|nr:hypothetical protein [Alistipes sp.]